MSAFMGPLDDQLWMQSLRDVSDVAEFIFNKFRVHAHERERMTVFINIDSWMPSTSQCMGA